MGAGEPPTPSCPIPWSSSAPRRPPWASRVLLPHLKLLRPYKASRRRHRHSSSPFSPRHRQSFAGQIRPPWSILALSISPLAPPSPHEAFALPSAAATARDRVCAVVFNLGPPPSEVSSTTVGSPVQSEIILLIQRSHIVVVPACSCACYSFQRTGGHAGTSEFPPERATAIAVLWSKGFPSISSSSSGCIEVSVSSPC
jgi:hypothetical protein